MTRDNTSCLPSSALAGLRGAFHSAEFAVGARADLLWLITSVVALVPVARLSVILAGVRDLAGITVVGVDAAEDATVDGDRILDDNVPRAAVAIAVTAAAHNLEGRCVS